MIRSVHKNEKPVTYDIPKPKKVLFTEDDLFEFDKKSFGSLIGPLTNHGTSIIALISYYKDLYEKNHNEEDLKKYNILCDRLKMVCTGQSKQIDKTKIGEEVAGLKKLWRQFQPKKDGDTPEDIKEKEFYNSILSDRKPYFFKYLYKTNKEKYSTAHKQFDKTSRRKFKMTIDELLKKEDKTPEEKRLVDYFISKTELIMSDCEMNRLCRYFEDLNIFIKEKVRDNSKFNYKALIDSEIEWNEDTYKDVVDMIKLYRSKKSSDKNANSLHEGPKTEVYFDRTLHEAKKKEMEVEINDIFTITSNVEELTNYLIKMFYEDNKSWDKALLWNLVGETIFERCYKLCDGVIKIPVLAEDGDIIFRNDKFKEVVIDLKEDQNG